MLSIIPYLHELVQVRSSLRIVLASGSPRRKEILSSLLQDAKNTIPFDVIVSSFAEDLDKELFKRKEDYVLETARKKTQAVADLISKGYLENNTQNESKKIKEDGSSSAGKHQTIVIGSDTIVVKDEHILEKPKDSDHAKKMMKMLSGATHHVFSAVIMIAVDHHADSNETKVNEVFAFTSCTNVTFDEMDDENIQAYIETGEPFDKAGGYGIQGIAKHFIKSINGCYYNVMGFPAHDFSKAFANYIVKLKQINY